MVDAFVRTVVLKRDETLDFDVYPFSIPAIRQLHELALDPKVTLFAGENGSGKSTLVEAIAIAAGFNAEGGSRNMTVSTRASHSVLHKHLRLVRGTHRPRTGYFLRAESFFNVATYVEELRDPGAAAAHGGISLHEQGALVRGLLGEIGLGGGAEVVTLAADARCSLPWRALLGVRFTRGHPELPLRDAESKVCDTGRIDHAGSFQLNSPPPLMSSAPLSRASAITRATPFASATRTMAAGRGSNPR